MRNIPTVGERIKYKDGKQIKEGYVARLMSSQLGISKRDPLSKPRTAEEVVIHHDDVIDLADIVSVFKA